LTFYQFDGSTYVQGNEINFGGQCIFDINLRGKYGIVSTTDNNGRAYMIQEQTYKYELEPLSQIEDGYFGCKIVSNANGDIFVSDPTSDSNGAVFYQLASYFQNNCVEQTFPSTPENNSPSNIGKVVLVESAKSGHFHSLVLYDLSIITFSIIGFIVVIIFIIFILMSAKKFFGKTNEVDYTPVSTK